MVFGGFQKLTLLDFPGKVSCTLFTKGCNFLCPFCHNAPLVTTPSDTPSFTEEEILDFLKKRQGILEGVCITGGEPLLYPLEDFLTKVKNLGYSVKLDTNGSFPDKLKALVKKKLVDYVAMDVKNTFAKYPETTGIENLNLDNIKESINFLLEGTVAYEFRTTVASELHTPQDIEEISQTIKGAEKYFLQNFLDSGNIIGTSLTPVPPETLEKMCQLAAKNTKYVNSR